MRQKSFSKASQIKHCIREAARRIDHRNPGAICKNVLCLGVESIDHAPAKLPPAKRRRFQTFKKASHKKWPFVTVDEKGDTCVNSEVTSAVVH